MSLCQSCPRIACPARGGVAGGQPDIKPDGICALPAATRPTLSLLPDKSNDQKPWPTLANLASLSHSDSILLPLPVTCPPRALLTTDVAANVDRITTHDLGRRVGGDASFKLLDKGYCGVPVRPVLDRIAVGDRTNVLTLALRDACNEADRAKMRPELAVAMDFDKATEAVNCIDIRHRRDPRATGTIIEPSLASCVSWRPSLSLRRPHGQLMGA